MSELDKKIRRNKELRELEKEGFIKGEKKGKTMDVSLETLVISLMKQYRDWRTAYILKNPEKMKRALADLRNVAGCVFLKLKKES